MGWRELARAWRASKDLHQFHPRASLDELAAVEEQLGRGLPAPLREFYRVSNGARLFGALQVYSLQPHTIKLNKPFVNPFKLNEPARTEFTTAGLATQTEFLRRHGWPIPAEVLVFGDAGSDELFGIWLPEPAGSTFAHPVLEIGEILDTPRNMAVAATSFPRFLRGWTAYGLLMNAGSDAALEAIGVPAAFKSQRNSESVWTIIRKWSDPMLPDPFPDPYQRGKSPEELRKQFAAP